MLPYPFAEAENEWSIKKYWKKKQSTVIRILCSMSL